MGENTRIASSASASTAAAFCTIMGFAASAVDVGRDWPVDEERMHRRCWRVRSTDLDGKDEDEMGTGKEDIEPHLCCFELLSENGLMFSESRHKGSKSGRSGHPASDIGWPCVDEMDTDREEIENEED